MWQIILPVVVIYFLALLIWLLWTFNELVRLEYKAHRPIWEKDGMSRGTFWIAPESRKRFGINLKSEWAFGRLNLVWLFSTPSWIREDKRALRLVHRLRILAILWNGSIIIPVIVLTLVFE